MATCTVLFSKKGSPVHDRNRNFGAQVMSKSLAVVPVRHYALSRIEHMWTWILKALEKFYRLDLAGTP